jgi:hypothetical protein
MSGTQRETLMAEIERLREALKPFAEAAESLGDKHRDESDIWESPAAMEIKAGDLRRARSIAPVSDVREALERLVEDVKNK